MKILTYIIPKELHSNNFIQSLAEQADKKGELSFNQIATLQDMIGVELDFYDWDYMPDNDYYPVSDYSIILKKLKADRFRKNKTKNTCVRAAESIVNGKPNWKYINKALGLDFTYGRRYY